MYAVEFETVIQDGLIKIPADFAEFKSQAVRVVLMMDEAPKQVKIAKLQALVDEGLASGISHETMQTLQEKALNRFKNQENL
ncbi:hypothetical protein [Thiosulfativibrio zosterae]|uniref:Antitoxin ParD n=1 Tax=Thiosulfativibrio zosterae TaxID=2675053 RepID=A0A6F8PJP0_9GAMM|nr:hypothetical protein [Thiosulfativibrio zosterae]BBP42321.1 hypothetical protein THMIRHAT_00670 [Thiosulfativibrio zosterae]